MGIMLPNTAFIPADAATPFSNGGEDPQRLYALIPCAGTGSRSGASGPKQYERLAGRRVIDHTVDAFLRVPALCGVGVVVAPDDSIYRSPGERVRVWHVGGATRAHSVFQGLQALAAAGARETDWVLVHDAARCLIRPSDIERLVAACAADAVGGLLALPLPDTLKQALADEAMKGPPRVAATVPRGDKWLAQTPQMFRWGVLYDALASHEPSGFLGITDEASAVEAAGHRPLLVTGSARNIKVTYPEDFAVAEALLACQPSDESAS
jgi:2-C-methyl-D-erythritol 4-phosphate cytidylyltransferase